jgi:hypothetical protein
MQYDETLMAENAINAAMIMLEDDPKLRCKALSYR